MNSLRAIAVAIFGAVAAITPPLPAQPATKLITARTLTQMKASYSADYGDFDCLLRECPDQSQTLDEYRVADYNGEKYYVITSLRKYNGALDRWEPVRMVTDYQQIEARRIWLPRSLGPLASAKSLEPTR
jgi:hypothetical protein